MPKLRQVIESHIYRGAGTLADLGRTVTQYHDVDGVFLAEHDPERTFISCHCPARHGEACPLTADECTARTEGRRPK